MTGRDDYAGDYGFREQIQWFLQHVWSAWLYFTLLLFLAYSLWHRGEHFLLLLLLPSVLWKLYGALYWTYRYKEATAAAHKDHQCLKS